MQFSETLNIDEMLTLTKQQIAEHQLEQALILFLDHKDYVCAITLAGASEEILGKLVEKDGKDHALGAMLKGWVNIGKEAYNEIWQNKEFFELANYFRNGLKHYDDGEPITIPREAAIEILDRAIENFWILTNRETPRMRQFQEQRYGK
jgi:hypothetical protein